MLSQVFQWKLQVRVADSAGFVENWKRFVRKEPVEGHGFSGCRKTRRLMVLGAHL